MSCRALGRILWNYCGMARNRQGLETAIQKIKTLRGEFWENLKVSGALADLNLSLEYAGRVADFFEFAELMCLDALQREESCGGHFREESQTSEGEAKRDDANFSYVAAWEYQGVEKQPILHKENLEFNFVKLSERSYK